VQLAAWRASSWGLRFNTPKHCLLLGAMAYWWLAFEVSWILKFKNTRTQCCSDNEWNWQLKGCQKSSH
jgi:hypothetical protein